MKKKVVIKENDWNDSIYKTKEWNDSVIVNMYEHNYITNEYIITYTEKEIIKDEPVSKAIVSDAAAKVLIGEFLENNK